MKILGPLPLIINKINVNAMELTGAMLPSLQLFLNPFQKISTYPQKSLMVIILQAQKMLYQPVNRLVFPDWFTQAR